MSRAEFELEGFLQERGWSFATQEQGPALNVAGRLIITTHADEAPSYQRRDIEADHRGEESSNGIWLFEESVEG